MASTVERFERCDNCRNVRHPYLFPYKNPDATLPDPVQRTLKAEPAKTFEKRLAAASAARRERLAEVGERRRSAQAEGRNTSKCLLCLSSEGSE